MFSEDKMIPVAIIALVVPIMAFMMYAVS